MSTWCSFRRLKGEEFNRLLRSPGQLRKVIGQGDSQNVLSIEQFFEAIHFLLTGRAEGNSTPIDFLWLGGTPIEEIEGSRYLTAKQTAEFATALNRLRVADLPALLSPNRMADSNIYPGADYWQQVTKEDAVRVVGEHLAALQTFASEAAEQSMVLVEYFV